MRVCIIGLLIGLHNIKVLVQAWPNTPKMDSTRVVAYLKTRRPGRSKEYPGSFHLVPVPAENVIQANTFEVSDHQFKLR